MNVCVHTNLPLPRASVPAPTHYDLSMSGIYVHPVNTINIYTSDAAHTPSSVDIYSDSTKTTLLASQSTPLSVLAWLTPGTPSTYNGPPNVITLPTPYLGSTLFFVFGPPTSGSPLDISEITLA